MKKVLSLVLVAALMIGMTGTAVGAGESAGKILMETAQSNIKVYSNMYKISPNSVDKYLDTVYAFVIMYCNGQILEQTETAKLWGQEFVEPLIKGFSDILMYVCDLRIQYSEGKITKSEFAKKLFAVADAQ